MTSVDHVTRILPGSPEWADLLTRSRGAKDRDLNDENPFDQVAALKRAGFGTLRLPAHRGGAGFTVPQLFSAVIDVAHADPIVAHIFRTHFWFVEERLRTADDAGSARWLHKVAEGKIFGNAFSEKGSLAVGSLVFNTRLLPADGGGYRLDGEKYYSTGTLFSDYLTVATTTDHDSVATVVVPADRDGVRLIDDWDGFGQRRTGTGTTVFTNVAVSNDEVLSDTPYDADAGADGAVRIVAAVHPRGGRGHPRRRSSTTESRCCARAIAASAMRWPNARPTTRCTRSNSANWPPPPTSRGPPCSTPPRRSRAATASAVPTAAPDARLAAEAQLKVAKVKVHLDDVAPEAATRLLELGGASAASRQRNLDRHWRNIRTITLHNPVAHKARVIGQNLLHGTPVPANAYF